MKLFAILHCLNTLLKPLQSLMLFWFWEHSRNWSQESKTHKMPGLAAGLPGAPGKWCQAGWVLPPPLKPPVMAWPRVGPTAEPTATLAVAVAIWAIRHGCLAGEPTEDGAAAAGG